MPSLDPGRAELDDTTLARARRGERAACTRFVAVYEARVFAAIGRIVGQRFDRGRVEELAQDAFVRALRALPRFSPAGPARLSTWLITIATRVALSELRRASAPVASLEEVPEPMHARDEHARLHHRDRLQRAIDDLTPEQRAVFVLRDVHGLTETEVGEALALEVPAVKSRLFRARARLRAVLGGDDE